MASLPLCVLIPLRTGKGSNVVAKQASYPEARLNPFENREGFELKFLLYKITTLSLNPFENREGFERTCYC